MDKELDRPQEPGIDKAASVPPNPEERAFSGHPDHPPAVPDQPLEGNRELLRGDGDDAE